MYTEFFVQFSQQFSQQFFVNFEAIIFNILYFPHPTQNGFKIFP